MGLLGYVISKGVTTAARNSTIKAVGLAASSVISAKALNNATKEDAVVKKGILYIKPTRSSEGYQNQDALEITRELLGVGFESVTLKPISKLGEWSTKKYGKIKTISINGHDVFVGTKKIPSTSRIVIEYLDFKSYVNQDAYRNVQRIIPGTVYSCAEIEKMTHRIETTKLVVSKKFCAYCGSPINSENARFCTSCGNEI